MSFQHTSHPRCGQHLEFGINAENQHLIVGRRRNNKNKSSSRSSTILSDGGMIAMKQVQAVVDKLSMERYRDSTRQTYYHIWKLFNQFFLKLDDKLQSWSDRLVLFTGFLVDSQLQSTMVKTYISTIKGILIEIGVRLNPDKFLLTSLTKACRLKNDVAVQRYAIRKGMLKMILDEVDKMYKQKRIQQPYLNRLFKTVYVLLIMDS